MALRFLFALCVNSQSKATVIECARRSKYSKGANLPRNAVGFDFGFGRFGWRYVGFDLVVGSSNGVDFGSGFAHIRNWERFARTDLKRRIAHIIQI